ncbi:hypothetical protein PR202_gb07315 [Eleusine coracana subsp. coracana]|uniref:Uncharacterized protein n=1 Tax=Eleusine coracana subsp. coracana TaxID=191504 RepID=A0AAV5E9E8_ELECO|nr:hypothetical protein PR202_gb07315 [Eleusine coracana subsp. coracana]
MLNSGELGNIQITLRKWIPQFIVQKRNNTTSRRSKKNPQIICPVAAGSKIYVIPSVPSQNHYDVDVNRKLSNIVEHERPDMCFTMVSRAGQHIVALGDTLSDVYVLDEPTFKWLPFKTSSSSVDLTRKVDICGFVDLIDDALMVSDVGKAECFLL